MLNTFAPTVINGYVWSQFKEHLASETKGYRTTQPFFPVYDNKGGESTWGNKPYVIYDVMGRFQMNPFYPIKREHLLYSVRGPVERMYVWRDFITQLLDRGDDSAKDINQWANENLPDNKVFLHDTRVFGMEFARDTTKRASVTATNFFVAELIVDYRFHVIDLFNE